nr:unnamed protein product [Callosobruchus chinensis]
MGLNLPPSVFIWLIYVVPSYSMSGLYMQSLNNYDGFYIYIVTSALFMLSGYTLHVKDLPEYLLWVQYIDPASWMLP